MKGSLVITKYQMQFKPHDEKLRVDSFYKRYFRIPIYLIEKIDKIYDKKRPSDFHLNIYTKDYRLVSLIPKDYVSLESIYSHLCAYSFPGRFNSTIFAFNYHFKPKPIPANWEKYLQVKELGKSIQLSSQLQVNGWDVYSAVSSEFERQGVPTSNGTEDPKVKAKMMKAIGCWQVSPQQILCKTYPRVIYVPANMTDDMIVKCAEFRTKNRLPALTYYYSENGASLWRSSQNKPGVRQNRCLEDEKMIKMIGETNPNTNKIVVFDARSKINAMANKVKSGGYENIESYTNCSIQFCNINNIHDVRKAYQKTFLHCNNPGDSRTFWTKIESYKWYLYIQRLLEGAVDISDCIKSGKNVLTHCSDGWDRTAQLCSLVQLLIDPFYRTLNGFEVLIEKDWVKFGHQFEVRSGHFVSENERQSE